MSLKRHYFFIDSSPPARGRLFTALRSCYGSRFIPSCEGQTSACNSDAGKTAIHPLLRGADVVYMTNGGFLRRFIPSCEGQTLSVYAAFSRLKHLVVQFAQMPFSTRHTSFSLHIICRKNIFFAIFPNIFLYFFNPHSVFIVYNNFFTFTHTVIFCVYLYIFKDSCFRPAEILKIFNF